MAQPGRSPAALSAPSYVERLAFLHPSSSGCSEFRWPAVITLAALAITIIIQRLTDASTYEIALLAVAFSAWYGGLLAGLLSAATGLLGTYLLATDPLYSLTLTKVDDIVSLLIFPAVALMIGVMYDARRLAERRSEQLLQVATTSEQRYRELVEQKEEILEDLESANAAKDEFLGLVSHELRSPITIILGNTKLLRDHRDQIEEADLNASLVDLHQSALRMQGLVENLLALARAGSQGSVENEPMQFRRVVAGAVREYQAAHSERELVLSMGEDRALVMGKPIYVQQIVLNLLTNATKYSPDGEAIHLAVDTEGDRIRLSVADRGQGIAQQDLDRVFRPFYRTNDALPHPGLGLGLAVCRRLVEAMEGTIWAQRRAGGGTEFVMLLPTVTADEAGMSEP